MSTILITSLCAVMLGTAFLSGVFGMAGGLILMGVLLALLPLPEAMVLHSVTQMASNGWRGLLWFRYVRWKAAGGYVLGCFFAVVAWSFVRYVPSTPVAFVMLGSTPFLIWLAPKNLKPNPESPWQGSICGLLSMSLMLLAGVSGPLIDTFFLSGGKLDRREIIATKAVCQILSHAAKLVYFGTVIDRAASLDPLVAALAVACSVLGTTAAARALEAMTDKQYRVWANRLIAGVAVYYMGYGAYLMVVVPALAR